MAQRKILALATATSFICALPVFAQTGWLLPTQVQGQIEAAAVPPSTTWILPNPLAFKSGVSGARSLLLVTRPDETLFALGTVVTIGFSGTMQRKPVWRKNEPEPDQADVIYRFLDPNGVSVGLYGVGEIGFAMNGAEVERPAYDNVLARDVGQVFGAAIDNAEFCNLYLTATSAYGLNITGPDENNDTVEDRLFTGMPVASWMAAQ